MRKQTPTTMPMPKIMLKIMPTMLKATNVAILAATILVFAQAASAKKDAVADSIAKARAAGVKARAGGADARTDETVDESATLKELLGDAKLVAQGAAAADAEKTAAAVMAGGQEAQAVANESAPKAEAEAAAVETAPAPAGDESAPTVEAGGVAAAIAAKPDVSKMNEKDIPVLVAKPKREKIGSATLARVLASAGILLALVCSAAWGMRKYTKRGAAKESATKIRILTQHHLGPKKSIAIVQVAGESVLVGITDHSITMLKTLSLIDDEVPEETPKNFDSTLEDYEFEGEGQPARAHRGQDDFAMRGLSDIRDSVSRRLKGLKQI